METAVISNWSKTLSARLPAWMQSAQVPGAVVTLLQAGSPPEYLCFGVARLEGGQPVTPQTVFQAASLSKQVFAYMALKQCERGLLALDAPLSDFLPEPYLPDEPRLPGITARRVLSHTTGLPNWCDEPPRRLKSTPGERFGYSGEGFVYLQRVIEKLTGQPLETAMEEAWFPALGMANSSFVWQENLEANLAQAHKQGKPHSAYCFVDALSAASLYTTTEDLAHFVQQVLDPPAPDAYHLSPLWLEAMFTPQTTVTPLISWSLGWGRLNGKTPVYWQWGDNTGYKHILAISPASRQGVIVLTNDEQGSQVWKQVLAGTLDAQGNIFTWLENL